MAKAVLRASIVFIAAILLAASSPVSAKFIPRVDTVAEKDGGASLYVNCRKALRLKTSNANLSPAQRVKIVEERLRVFLRGGGTPSAVWYKKVGKANRVMVGDTVLAIATTSEAKAQGISTAKLAQTWVHNLRSLMSLPPLTVRPTKLLVPLNESRTISVESLLTDPVEAQVSNPELMKGDARPGSLTVTGTALGDGTISLKCGECSTTVNVSVKKYAAYAARGPVRATITGSSPPESLIERTVKAAVLKGVNLESGASIIEISTPKRFQEVLPGRSIEVLAQVRATGDGYINAVLPVKVQVANQVLIPATTSELLYSNDPERIGKYQVLFTGWTDAGKGPVRLLYHHQNMMGKKVGFVIDVVNSSNAAADLHVVEGVAKPMVDTVIVGYRAGLDFMENQGSSTGRIVEVGAGTRRVVVSQGLEALHTASGILEFRQLSGDRMLVRVLVKPEEQRVVQDPLDSQYPATEIQTNLVALSEHVFPDPKQSYDVSYVAGKAWQFLRIGKDHLKHATRDMLLYGNYGVIYDIKVNLTNPTEIAYTAELAFEATAGPVSGVFYVDGRLVKVRLLQSPEEATLEKVVIPGGATRTVIVRTIPLSGSAYPATLIVRPAGTMSSKLK